MHLLFLSQHLLDSRLCESAVVASLREKWCTWFLSVDWDRHLPQPTVRLGKVKYCRTPGFTLVISRFLWIFVYIRILVYYNWYSGIYSQQ